MPYRLIKDFAAQQIMPNFQKLIESGTFTKMRSSLPEISSVAWSSVITGHNAGKHGVYGFTDIAPDSYRQIYNAYPALQSEPFWVRNSADKHVILNVPATYPVKEMSGAHLAGFVAPNLDKAVYPPDLLRKLKDIDYRVDVDAGLAHDSIPLFLSELDKVLDARLKAIDLLWDFCDWQTFMPVFTGTDRLGHFLWDAYEDPDHQYRSEFEEHFSKIDEMVGVLLERKTPEDNVYLFADHGFESRKKEVYLNRLLEEEGYLSWEQSPPRSIRDIATGSKAFCMDPGRIYLNDDRFPDPAVTEQNRDEIINELQQLFSNLTCDGEKVIKKVHKREQIYEGDCFQRAPDLVLLCESGYSLRGTIKKQKVFGEELFTGQHTYADAFFLSERPTSIPEGFSVENVLSVINQ